MNDARYLLNALQEGSEWRALLEKEFEQPYMIRLADFLAQENQQGKTIFPSLTECFTALNSTDFSRVRVVILGQDPYHGPGQAHGLSFSVKPGVAIPPSLRNIFAEIRADLGLPPPAHGCLGYWAQQGVLLLNAVLTVEQGLAASHQGKGWEHFTDRIVECLTTQREGLVFMLWGSHAQRKGRMIDRSRHLVLESTHPSPLSAHRGFLGCHHFSTCNQQLERGGGKGIDWRVPPVDRLDEKGFLVKKDRAEAASHA